MNYILYVLVSVSMFAINTICVFAQPKLRVFVEILFIFLFCITPIALLIAKNIFLKDNFLSILIVLCTAFLLIVGPYFVRWVFCKEYEYLSFDLEFLMNFVYVVWFELILGIFIIFLVNKKG